MRLFSFLLSVCFWPYSQRLWISGTTKSLLLLAGWIGYLHVAHASEDVDFGQQYERGKLMIQQQFFSDAVKSLERAVRLTEQGKNHFGAHFLLAGALWKMGDVARAKEVLQRAKQIMARMQRTWAVSQVQQRRRMVRALEQKIQELFGVLRIIPEVEPDSVGRLKIRIEPVDEPSQADIKRILRYLDDQLRNKGLVLGGKPIYLPKANYRISIEQPQCLRYALTVGQTVMKEIVISDQEISLAVKEKVSCQCTQGRVLQRNGNRLACVCPTNSIWNAQRNRCETVKVTDSRPWISRNWPWITVAGIAVVAAGVIIPIVVIESQNRDRDIVLQGSLFTKP